MNHRNARLCLHPDYICRPNPTAFDDRPFKDEWQDNVYRIAAERAASWVFDRPRIADFGCGSGFKLMKYFSHYDTTGYEIEPALTHLRETYEGRNWVDGSELPTFDCDLLICADVIEHLVDPIALLETIAESKIVTYVFLSTPSLEILADRGQSPRRGPPNNTSHFNEWSTREFSEFVGRYLNVVEHTVPRVNQGTQMIVARVR